MRDLERQPGVTSAGLVTNIPFSGRDIKSAITVKGWVPPAGESVRGHYGFGVGGRYFAALGVPLIEGRLLDPAEIQRGARTSSWTRSSRGATGRGRARSAGRLFAGPKAGPDAEAYTVVGVVGSVRQTGLTDTAATGAVFFPYSARFEYRRCSSSCAPALAPAPLAATLRHAVRPSIRDSR